MDEGRRFFLGAFLPGMMLAAAGLQSPEQFPPPPGSPTVLPPPWPPGHAPTLDRKAILKDDQKKIQKDVQRLFLLAQQLKEQVEKTDSSDVLSLSLIQKAGEIEKLAKQIKNLARG